MIKCDVEPNRIKRVLNSRPDFCWRHTHVFGTEGNIIANPRQNSLGLRILHDHPHRAAHFARAHAAAVFVIARETRNDRQKC